MVRLKKRTVQSQNARLKAQTIKDPVRFVVSALVNGLGLQQSSEFLLENGIIPPSKKDCYKIQKLLLPKIEACARESCKKACQEMEFGDSLLHDGAWSNKRNAPHMILTYISAMTHKILDYAIISKNAEVSDAAFSGASNTMESFAHKILAPKWRDNKYIVARVHDQDVNSYKEFVGPTDEADLPSFLDPGHIQKSFERVLEKYQLFGIKSYLTKRFKYIVNLAGVSVNQKRDMWLDTSNQLLKEKLKFNPLISIQSKHITAEKCKEELGKFIEETIY